MLQNVRKGELPFRSYIWDFCAPKKQCLWLCTGVLSAFLHQCTISPCLYPVPSTLHPRHHLEQDSRLFSCLPLSILCELLARPKRFLSNWKLAGRITGAVQLPGRKTLKRMNLALNCIIKDFSLIICPKTSNASHSGGTGTVCWGQMEQELFHGRIRGWGSIVSSWMFVAAKCFPFLSMICHLSLQNVRLPSGCFNSI